MRCLWLIILLLIGTTTANASDLKSSSKDELINPRSWPATKTIEGKEVHLRILQISKEGVSEVKSTQELKPNERCEAQYYYMKTFKKILHGPSYTWRRDGRIDAKNFFLEGVRQYQYNHYPTGEVAWSTIYDKKANQIITNWYEKDGRLAGQYIMNDKPSGQMRQEDNMYFWNGKKISMNEYVKRINPYMLISVQP